MKRSKVFFAFALPLLTLLGGCGGSGGASGVSALVEGITVSVVEKSSGTLDAAAYFEGADSYRFIDTDGEPQTVVTDGGAAFVSPELNMTVDGSDIRYTAGNVETTKHVAFVLAGVTGSKTLELNASFEITDTADDAATALQDVGVPASAGVLEPGVTVTATATDPDGMHLVAVALLRDATALETLYVYPETNLSRIDVNETFANPGEGNYTVTFTALGTDGGEGYRSIATAARAVNVSLLNDLAGILEDINSTLSALGGTLTAGDIAALLEDINQTLHEGSVNIDEAAVTVLLNDINGTLTAALGSLGDTDLSTLIGDIGDTLTAIGGGVLGGLGL